MKGYDTAYGPETNADSYCSLFKIIVGTIQHCGNQPCIGIGKHYMLRLLSMSILLPCWLAAF